MVMVWQKYVTSEHKMSKYGPAAADTKQPNSNAIEVSFDTFVFN